MEKKGRQKLRLKVCQFTFIVKFAKGPKSIKILHSKTNTVNLELLIMTELNSQNINYLRKKNIITSIKTDKLICHDITPFNLQIIWDFY